MNKSTIISNINGFITALITQLKTRNAFLEVVTNLWSTIYDDTKQSTSLTPLDATTPLLANVNYNLVLSRSGNKVFVQGWVFNAGTIPTTAFAQICTIDIAELESKEVLASFVAISPTTNDAIQLAFSDKLTAYSSIPVGQYFYFNGIYFTND